MQLAIAQTWLALQHRSKKEKEEKNGHQIISGSGILGYRKYYAPSNNRPTYLFRTFCTMLMDEHVSIFTSSEWFSDTIPAQRIESILSEICFRSTENPATSRLYFDLHKRW